MFKIQHLSMDTVNCHVCAQLINSPTYTVAYQSRDCWQSERKPWQAYHVQTTWPLHLHCLVCQLICLRISETLTIPLPCTTPLINSKVDDNEDLNPVWCVHSLKNWHNHCSKFPLIPYEAKRANNLVWDTVSIALLPRKSTYAIVTEWW